MKKFIALILSIPMLLVGCAKTDTPKAFDQDGIKIEILKEGTGAVAKVGDNLSMQYVGTLLDGTKFDSSRDRGKPFHFTLGGGQVIEGWDKGLVGMKVGELRKLTIPAAMAYGERGIGPIPPNSDLVFEVELVEIVDLPFLKK